MNHSEIQVDRQERTIQKSKLTDKNAPFHIQRVLLYRDFYSFK
jgi:hypothetical protein